jgi:hypothetical protein
MTVLYEQDSGLWAEQMANLLATGRFLDRLFGGFLFVVHHILAVGLSVNFLRCLM